MFNSKNGATAQSQNQSKESVNFVSDIVPTLCNVDYNHIYSYRYGDFPGYHMFKPYLNNRQVKGSHLKNIKKAIANGVKLMPPILVNIDENGNMMVADGNFRMTAINECHDEGSINDEYVLRVIFISIPSDEIEDFIIDLNCGSKTWKKWEIIASRAKRCDDCQETEGWKLFTEFCKKKENEDLFKGNGGNMNYGYACHCLGINRNGAERADSPISRLTEADIKKGQFIKDAFMDFLHTHNVLTGKSDERIVKTGGWIEIAIMEFRRAFEASTNYDEAKKLKFIRVCREQYKNKDKVGAEAPMGRPTMSDWRNYFKLIKFEFNESINNNQI